MNHSKNSKRKNDYESAYSFSSNLINTMHNAIKSRKLITIEYHSREKGLTKREIEPMDIITRDGRTNLVGWCRLRNDWRTFRIDRVNFVAIQMQNDFVPNANYKREDFADENSRQHEPIQEHTQKNNTQNGRPNKELNMEMGFGKTMTDNKLKLNLDSEIVKYSEDEDDLAL
jgi:predicted DNA-binding transcriptional regulator YafY